MRRLQVKITNIQRLRLFCVAIVDTKMAETNELNDYVCSRLGQKQMRP
jgi:hypothetical protein